ncbi:MAG: DUF6783 domain-containing protein [Blautia faecicola]
MKLAGIAAIQVSVDVARYAALIRLKSPTNWDSQLTKSLFQTRSRKVWGISPVS